MNIEEDENNALWLISEVESIIKKEEDQNIYFNFVDSYYQFYLLNSIIRFSTIFCNLPYQNQILFKFAFLP